MSELQSRFCWRCLFFALVPLIALVAVAWAALSSAYSERATVAESTGGLVEQLADLDGANADLRRELATTREALQAARGAALATGGGNDDLAARIASLPERERFALLDQAGVTVFGPDELIDRLSRMPEGAQSRVFEALPSMEGFQGWYEAIGKDEQRQWLGRLPGGAQPIRYQSIGEGDLIREARLPGSACDCSVEASGPNKLLQSVQLLTPSERAVFFPALAEATALPEWFGVATPGERVEFVNALPEVEQVDIRVQSNRPMAPISLAEALEREAGLTARLEASDMALRATKARAQGEPGGDASLDELQTALSRAEVARDEAAARTRQIRADLLRAQRDLQSAARARAANESALREARTAVARVEAEKNLAATAIAQLESQIGSLNEERVRLVNALEAAAPSTGPTRLAQADTGAEASGGLRARLSEAMEELTVLRAERARLINRINAVEGSAADALESLRRQREATASARSERDAALTRSEDAAKAAQSARASLEALRTQSEARIAQLETNAQSSDRAEDDALRARISQLEGALKAAETGAESQRRAAAAASERSRSEIDRLTAQLAESRKAVADASSGASDVTALRQEISRLEGALKAAETAAESQRRAAAAALNQSRSDVARLEGEVKAAKAAAESHRRAAAAALAAHQAEKADLTRQLQSMRDAAPDTAAPDADAAALVKSLEAQLAALRQENARLGGDLERIARERDSIIEQTTQRMRRSQQRVAGLETEVVRLNAELSRLDEAETGTADAAALRTLKAGNAGLEAANRRLTDERDGARQAAKERESALNDQIEALRGANRELSRKLSEAAVRIAGIDAAGDDGAQAVRVLLRQLQADKNGLVARIDRLTSQLTGLREASEVREEALKSRITAATRARQAMQVERDMAIDAARRIAAGVEGGDEGGAKPTTGPATAGVGDAALRAERDAAVALALRLQAEVERGVQTLMIEGRDAMTAEAVASTLRALESDHARLRAALDEARSASNASTVSGGADPEALKAAIERAERAESALSRARQGLDALALAEQERDAEKDRAEAALKWAREGLDALSAAKREQDLALERATRAEAALDRARDGLDRLAKAETEREAALERAERAETALDRARSGLDTLTSAQRERDDAVARADRAEAALRQTRAELASASAGRSDGAAAPTGGDADAAVAAMRQARDVAIGERDRARADLADARQGFSRASAEVAGLKAELERSQQALSAAAAPGGGAGETGGDGVKLVDRPDLAVDGDVVALRRQIAALESALARVGDRDRDDATRRGAIVERLRVSMGATETASLSLPVGPLVTPPLRLDGALVFEPGDATVSAKGKEKLAELATELKRELAAQPDRPWRLAIEGHTDRRPISTSEFPSNWTLSAARAAAVAKVLEDLGVPARRLLAIGRAEYDPVDPANTTEAYAANRRIEFDIVSR